MKHVSVEWAYPTSYNARKLGFNDTGCWTVEIGEPGHVFSAKSGHATKEQAVAAAQALGITLECHLSPVES